MDRRKFAFGKTNFALLAIGMCIVVIGVFFLYYMLKDRRKGAGTAEAESLEENPYVSAWFSEELSLTVDGRSFLAEDAPENEAEEAVFREWLTEFLQDPELYLEDCPESRKGLPEVRNTLENYEQGRYQIQEFVLHELEAVSAEEQAEAEENYLLGREEIIEQCGLTESRIVRADWTEEREEPVNYGNGFHSRYYLCGKSEEDPVWRIYAYGIM